MKVLSNSLSPLIDEWSDPGDYPNNVAQGPLSSYEFCEIVEGDLQILISREEFENIESQGDMPSGDISDDDLEVLNYDLWELVDRETPSSIEVQSWNVDVSAHDHGYVFKFDVKLFEHTEEADDSYDED